MLGLGCLLREARLSSGLSLSDAAQKVGISRQYLEAVEAGRKGLSIAQAERIALALGYKLVVEHRLEKLP